MKVKSILAALLLMVAGLQSAKAQHGMQVWQNGKFELYFINNVDSVRFVNLVTDIYLSQGDLTMNVGERKRLTTTVYPIDADDHTVTWESSAPDIAFVDENGLVTAASPGTAVITATATDGSGTKAECQITVIQLVTGITLSETSLSLITGASETLTAIVVPSNASNPAVAWENNNESIATVDQTGKVTAVSPGSCIITATAVDGSGVKAECQVTVIQLVIGITLSQTSLTLTTGGSGTLTASVEPSNASNRAVTWESNDESIATVDQTGKVTAVSAGSCTITVTADDGSGVTAECQVTVEYSETIEHEWVDLCLPSGTMWATCNVGANSPEEYGDYFAWGETETKEVYSWETYKYCNGTNNTLTKYCTDKYYGYNGYKDNKTALDAMDDAAAANWADGWQMPTNKQFEELISNNNTTTSWWYQNGVAGRLITSRRNGKSIFLPAAGMRYDTSLNMAGTGGQYWSRSLYSIDTGASFLDFSSSNVITMGDAGRCCGRSVRPVRFETVLVTGITLSQTSLTMKIGSSQTLTANFQPINASLKEVEWSSSDENVATINQTGNVTGVANGVCTITATAKDGSGISATCKVIVHREEAYVDLGLPSGTLWAECNIGADNPEDLGDYFAWGETEPKSNYDWFTYQYCNGSYNSMTKYCDNSSYGRVDNKTELELIDDAAYVNWGDEWCMPSKAQQEELRSKCTWTYKRTGTKGFEVKGPNGNSIFLPAAGYRNGWNLKDEAETFYWSRTFSNANRAYNLDSHYNTVVGHSRSDGLSIRPVRK